MSLSGPWTVDAKKTTLYFSLFFAFLISCFFLIDLFLSPNSKEFLVNCWSYFSDILIDNGFLLFLAIAFLPALILPVSPLLALAGIWGESNGILLSSVLGTLCLITNCCWTYWMARVFGLNLINRFVVLLKRNPITIPEGSGNTNFFLWSLVLRLTPGIPFIFSNLILGAVKMPFHLYLLISIPILTCSSFGYIYATAGLIGGDFANLGGGLAIILCFFIAGRIILKKKKNAV